MFLLLVLCFAGSGAFDDALRAGLEALNKSDFTVAREKLESAARLRPESGLVWVALAETYHKQHRDPDAEAAVEKAEKIGATDATVWRGLAAYYSRNANYGKAARTLERYSNASPQDPDAAVQTAILYARANEPQPAVSAAKRAARLKPYEESTYFPVAQELLQHQQFDASLEVLQEGLQVFSKSAQLELAAGVAYYGLRRFPQAIDAFLKTIEFDPTVEQPYIFLGRMLDVAEGNLPAITEVFRKFAGASPNNPLASFEYAKALALSGGDGQQIEALLRHSLELKPNSWESHYELGLALERRHAFDEAAKEVEQSVKLNPDAPVLHYRLARLYDRLGRTSDAAAQRALHAKLTAESHK